MNDLDPKFFTWSELLPHVKHRYQELFGLAPDKDLPDEVLICLGARILPRAASVFALADEIVFHCAKRLALRGTPQVKRDDPIGFSAFMFEENIQGFALKAEGRARAELTKKKLCFAQNPYAKCS